MISSPINGYSIVGGHPRVPPLFRADTQVRPYKANRVLLTLQQKII